MAMVQAKFSIDADTVSTFKSRCAAEGVSMTSVIARWMRAGSPSKAISVKADTRPQRKGSVLETIALLNVILQKEEDYRDAIPEAFQSRYEVADQACDLLSQAISCLEDAF